MKKTLLAMAVATSFAVVPFTHAADLDTEEKKVSYSLGVILGQKLSQDMKDMDLDAFQAGLKAVYDGKTPEMSEEEIGKTMQSFQMKKIEEQRKAMDELGNANKEAGAAYMAENAKKENVKTTESGLQYEELVAGSGAQPTAEDTVKVHYRGTLIDGTEFDSSYSRNEPVSFPLGGVIPGWTEGLQLMKEGGKAKLVIPSDLAYGPGGMGNAIGPNSTLVFEVELLEVNPKDQ
jgi:FKBP-type peptidyl-prolyl cis-trans isomerase